MSFDVFRVSMTLGSLVKGLRKEKVESVGEKRKDVHHFRICPQNLVYLRILGQKKTNLVLLSETHVLFVSLLFSGLAPHFEKNPSESLQDN